jgi:hypothetical protein
MTIAWVYDDGGRAAAGFRGSAGDCSVRAIAIATGLPYRKVYDDLFAGERETAGRARGRGRKVRSPREGVRTSVLREYLADLGWAWTPTMGIGTGTTVHLRAAELPAGRLVARCSRHLVAVLDGVIHDTHDPSRDGTRAVYGYWTQP